MLCSVFAFTDDTKQLPVIPGLCSGVGTMIYAGSIGTQIANELIDCTRCVSKCFVYVYYGGADDAMSTAGTYLAGRLSTHKTRKRQLHHRIFWNTRLRCFFPYCFRLFFIAVPHPVDLPVHSSWPRTKAQWFLRTPARVWVSRAGDSGF